MELSNFTNLNSLSKTLRFKLIPVGNTEKNLEANAILASDKKRAEEYEKVKEYLDRYHKEYIEERLRSFTFNVEDLEHFKKLYSEGKTDELKKVRAKMLGQVSKYLKGGDDETAKERYKSLFSKKMVKNYLQDFLTDENEKASVKLFEDFWTYFSGYCENRENMYSGDEKSTEIAYRIVVQNLPKFIDNIKIWEKVSFELPEKDITTIDNAFKDKIGLRGKEIFKLETFNSFLTQSGIEKFNTYIGADYDNEGDQIQGLNQIINLYSQASKQKLPKIKPLFKQILSDRETRLFIPSMFLPGEDEKVLSSVKEYIELSQKSIIGLHKTIVNLNAEKYDLSKIYIKADTHLTTVSQTVYGSWSAINEGIRLQYINANPKKKSQTEDKYRENVDKELKKKKSYSICDVETAVIELKNKDFTEIDLLGKLIEKENILTDALTEATKACFTFSKQKYPEDKKLASDDEAIDIIKRYFDALKDYQRWAESFAGSGDESDKDPIFYSEYEKYKYEIDSLFNPLYNAVRNYLTNKSYTLKKIPLTFNIGNLLNGWVESKTENSDNGTQYCGYLFRKKNQIDEFDYFLGISANKKLFSYETKVEPADYSEYQRLNYYQPKEQTVYGSAYCGNYSEDKEMLKRSILKSLQKLNEPLYQEISLFFEGDNSTPKGAIERIKNNDKKTYDLLLEEELFKDANEKVMNNIIDTVSRLYRVPRAKTLLSKSYRVFTEIMDDVSDICSDKIFDYESISQKEFICAVEDSLKPLYLFKITNKDLSFAEKYSSGERKARGIDNLHTMYFKELMSGNQSKFDIGSGTVFYREKSIPYYETHKANVPILKKQFEGESVFTYPLCKDKRFMFDQFMFHLSFVQNYKSDKQKPKEMVRKLNALVNEQIKKSDGQYVIGIDRGERNLLYISVIDPNGNIEKPTSLNLIQNEYDGKPYKTDYRNVLKKISDENDENRKSWKTIKGIKDAKEGYLSYAVNEICKLVVKYNAVIAMEALNKRFKENRSAIEFSVYQKFEAMLANKLSYLADKKKDSNLPGGILNGYQLAAPVTSFDDMTWQNGIIFYVPAWLTSKIDPTTGFVDLLHPKYSNTDDAKAFFDKFDFIRFNKEENMFEFGIDYDKFGRQIDYRKKWVVCTAGERIRTFRNSEKNGQWDNETVILTDKFIKLFNDYGIVYESGDLKQAICRQTEKTFFTELLKWFGLTLQMRNSITGTDIDYLVSPVKNKNGEFFDSRSAGKELPQDADANGAYNIARKGLWITEQLRNAEDLNKVNYAMTEAQWLEYAQK